MVYNKFQDLELSALGMGAMRLPLVGGDDAAIDEAAAGEMVARALEGGINYFDTAWGYHGGNSERVLGRLLSAYPRERFHLATKFPGYDLANMGRAGAIFEEQLEKCRVDYFDFYLLHNVCELNIDAYLDEQYGLMPYLKRQKEAGRIRHLGFSAHGSYEVMERFLRAWGPEMEFCQIQLNYLDWTFQGAREKVALLAEHGLPVISMEPLRGGKLAALPDEDAARLRALRPDEGVPAWAFRFLQSIPGVVLSLSGMSSLAQLEENLATYARSKPLSGPEMEALLAVAAGMVNSAALPCTACRYCLSYCPQQLDIPRLLALYNEDRVTDGGFLAPMTVGALPEERRPAACAGCGQCEAVCPQQIGIAAAMADFAARLAAR